jgi:glycosyltransferase involved in cell wall biosynthesis
MQIVWFAEIKWDYLKTRKQQIISRKPAGVQLLYLEPYTRGRRNVFRLRTEGDLFCATIPFIKAAPSFLWRTMLDRSATRHLVDFTAKTRIRQLLKGLNFDTKNAGFIISNIYAADIAIDMRKKFLLYDCNDDHASFPGMRSWTQAYFRRTAHNADAVFASSQALLQKVETIRGDRGGCAYLGNGVDCAHFADGTGEALPDLGGDKPRLGYIGALAPCVDFDAIAEVARRHPEWEFVLVGPVLHGVGHRILELTALPNVFQMAAVSYDRLPGILGQFDAGLIPFKYNELTRGVNPNKLYEYFAAGLPVVATRFSEEVTKYPGLAKAVDPGDAFVAACEETIGAVANSADAAAIAAKARRAAEETDWNIIAEAFWNKVAELAGGGSS